MSKWAIMLGGADIWFTDGEPDRFNSEAEAIAALNEEILECEHAAALGYLTDAGDFEDFRIVEVA